MWDLPTIAGLIGIGVVAVVVAYLKVRNLA